MQFVADENVDFPIVQALRREGHSVWYVAEEAASISDLEVLKRTNALGAILLTGDKDFGELVFRQKSTVRGVVFLRLGGLKPDEKAARVLSALEQCRPWEGAFIVIQQNQVRRRTL